MKLWDTILRAFVGDPGDPLMLDNVPLGSLDCRTPDKIASARQRLGRPFAIEHKTERKEPPSYVLEHINAQSEAARKATVTNINQHRRKK